MEWITWIALAVAAAASAAGVVAWVRGVALERQRDAGRLRVREAEQALQQERDRIDALAADAHETMARAHASQAQLSRFLAAASHDLRQPVHAIALFVAALQSEPLQGRARTIVERLDRSLSGLDELFNRLLDISRLDAGAIRPSRSIFPIAGLLRPLEARFGSVAADRGLRLRVRTGRDTWVDSDPALLVEMLMNLVSNAFRYTSRGGVLLAVRRRGDRVLLQVWDTGAGIPRNRLETIFEEFVQLDNPSHDRRRGLGLGLAIVQRLSAALEHPVSVRSTPGRGSVFEISVPIAQAPVGASLAALEDPGGADVSGLLVLVVDDEIDILVATEALLSSWGCFVLPARSIAEAIERIDASERYPDLVITDHRVGGDATGFEVVAATRRMIPMPIPALMLSGDASPSLALRAHEAGLRFLDKPIDPRRLRAVLEAAAARRAPDADPD